jgi:hypothetical protein
MRFATDTILELEDEAKDALHFIQSSDTRVVLLAEASCHLARCLEILDQVLEGGEPECSIAR